ncbi:MAG TPA: hypothetical protein VF821_34105 [Lentzea sp.]
MNTLQLNIVLPDGDDDDAITYLNRVLLDMRSQGRWQREYLVSEKGVPLRDPDTFLRIGTVSVRSTS